MMNYSNSPKNNFAKEFLRVVWQYSREIKAPVDMNWGLNDKEKRRKKKSMPLNDKFTKYISVPPHRKYETF